MPLETLIALLRQFDIQASQRALDSRTGKTRRPVLVDASVAVRGDLEGVVEGRVELRVCELGLRVGVVGIAAPRGIG